MAAVTWSANLTEKAMGVPLGVARTIREEVFRAGYAGVDWVERLSHSSFKVVREALERTDKASRGAVEGLESVAGAILKVIRGSGETVGETGSSTAAPPPGTEETSPKVTVAASA